MDTKERGPGHVQEDHEKELAGVCVIEMLRKKDVGMCACVQMQGSCGKGALGYCMCPSAWRLRKDGAWCIWLQGGHGKRLWGACDRRKAMERGCGQGICVCLCVVTGILKKENGCASVRSQGGQGKKVQDVCISAISGRHGVQAYVCSRAERPEKECEGCVQL